MTARRLVNASLSDNTRRAYAGALGPLDAWLDGRRLEDARPRRLPRRAARCRARLLQRRDDGRRGPLPRESWRPSGELTARILAGNWKTSRMVAHHSAGATAERGAVARYL